MCLRSRKTILWVRIANLNYFGEYELEDLCAQKFTISTTLDCEMIGVKGGMSDSFLPVCSFMKPQLVTAQSVGMY